MHRFADIVRRCKAKEFIVLPALETMSTDLADSCSSRALQPLSLPPSTALCMLRHSTLLYMFTCAYTAYNFAGTCLHQSVPAKWRTTRWRQSEIYLFCLTALLVSRPSRSRAHLPLMLSCWDGRESGFQWKVCFCRRQESCH